LDGRTGKAPELPGGRAVRSSGGDLDSSEVCERDEALIDASSIQWVTLCRYGICNGMMEGERLPPQLREIEIEFWQHLY
jgi:hypothetical protein